MFKVCQFVEDYNRYKIEKNYKNCTVPHLYQVNGKAAPPGESQVMNDKDWGYV